MCTLSWQLNEQGYEIFFNRDEQRSRAKAELPSFYHQNKTIMPIDPQGGGTWIAVNQSGISLCLLNLYQHDKHPADEQKKKFKKNKPHSRGLLIPRLIQYQNYELIIKQIKQLELDNYRPFTLCVFPENLNSKQNHVAVYQWNGQGLQQQKTSQLITSSSIAFHQVQRSRIENYHHYINRDSFFMAKNHLDYHCSHRPEKSHLSVCMHREDARTQSLSHIKVDREIVFSYHDGSPCKNNAWFRLKLRA